MTMGIDLGSVAEWVAAIAAVAAVVVAGIALWHSSRIFVLVLPLNPPFAT